MTFLLTMTKIDFQNVNFQTVLILLKVVCYTHLIDIDRSEMFHRFQKGPTFLKLNLSQLC